MNVSSTQNSLEEVEESKQKRATVGTKSEKYNLYSPNKDKFKHVRKGSHRSQTNLFGKASQQIMAK